ncbi:hypothetical protein F5Y03DRAFT_46125 [Xylaria venustula]|nr:hypothetical protein F5Y03DRAFT_46125 [Xylaria venustula]
MVSSSRSPRMIELAAKISSFIAELQSLLSAQGLSSPSFNEYSPESLPASAANLQDAVLDATAELHELLLEPMSAVFGFSAGDAYSKRYTVCEEITKQPATAIWYFGFKRIHKMIRRCLYQWALRLQQVVRKFD